MESNRNQTRHNAYLLARELRRFAPRWSILLWACIFFVIFGLSDTYEKLMKIIPMFCFTLAMLNLPFRLPVIEHQLAALPISGKRIRSVFFFHYALVRPMIPILASVIGAYLPIVFTGSYENIIFAFCILAPILTLQGGLTAIIILKPSRRIQRLAGVMFAILVVSYLIPVLQTYLPAVLIVGALVVIGGFIAVMQYESVRQYKAPTAYKKWIPPRRTGPRRIILNYLLHVFIRGSLALAMLYGIFLIFDWVIGSVSSLDRKVLIVAIVLFLGFMYISFVVLASAIRVLRSLPVKAGTILIWALTVCYVLAMLGILCIALGAVPSMVFERLSNSVFTACLLYLDIFLVYCVVLLLVYLIMFRSFAEVRVVISWKHSIAAILWCILLYAAYATSGLRTYVLILIGALSLVLIYFMLQGYCYVITHSSKLYQYKPPMKSLER
jgi:hypothetical protein